MTRKTLPPREFSLPSGCPGVPGSPSSGWLSSVGYFYSFRYFFLIGWVFVEPPETPALPLASVLMAG